LGTVVKPAWPFGHSTNEPTVAAAAAAAAAEHTNLVVDNDVDSATSRKVLQTGHFEHLSNDTLASERSISVHQHTWSKTQQGVHTHTHRSAVRLV